jgi:hypothetical protein
VGGLPGCDAFTKDYWDPVWAITGAERLTSCAFDESLYPQPRRHRPCRQRRVVAWGRIAAPGRLPHAGSWNRIVLSQEKAVSPRKGNELLESHPFVGYLNYESPPVRIE